MYVGLVGAINLIMPLEQRVHFKVSVKLTDELIFIFLNYCTLTTNLTHYCNKKALHKEQY